MAKTLKGRRLIHLSTTGLIEELEMIKINW